MRRFGEPIRARDHGSPASFQQAGIDRATFSQRIREAALYTMPFVAGLSLRDGSAKMRCRFRKHAVCRQQRRSGRESYPGDARNVFALEQDDQSGHGGARPASRTAHRVERRRFVGARQGWQ
jgi:hypothetical protein